MIILCYNQFALGVLTKTEDGFVYNSNLKGEEEAKKVYQLFDYKLWDSKNRTSKTLFKEFITFIEECTRPDILEKAGIKKDDDSYTRLEKLSNLIWHEAEYHIKRS